MIPDDPAQLIDRFCTPPRRDDGAPAADGRLPRGAEPLAVAFEGVTARGFRLQAADPEGNGEASAAPRALLVHGWGSRALDFLLFARALREAGHTVVAFDAPAHGATPGDRASLPIFTRFLVRVAAEVGPIALAVGHSLGAAACVLAAVGHPASRAAPVPIGRLALLSCPDTLEDMFRSWLRGNGLPESLVEPMGAALTVYDGHFPEHFSIAEVARRLDRPTLMVHDADDDQVPFARAEAMAASTPGVARFLATAGHGHGGLLRQRAVVRAVLDFARA